MNNFKKFLFFTLANIFLFFLFEIILTFFFVFHKTNYYGPLAKIFLSEKNVPEKTVLYNIRYNKKTGMHVPGKYNFNDINLNVNKFGFIGEEVDIENKTGCRIVALGGSTTAGIETNNSYPNILENLLNQNQFDCDVLNFGFTGKALNFLEKLLVKEASKFNPNIVLLMSNRNSTMYDSFVTSSVATDIIESKFDLYLYEIKNFLYLEVMTYRFMNLAYNRMISLLVDDSNKIISPFNPKNFHSKKYFQSGYKDQILRINSYCEEKGIKLVLVKQAFYINPDMQNKINLLSKEDIIIKLLNYNKKKDYFDKQNLFWMYTNAILNKNLDEIEAKNITIIDPTKILYKKDKKDFFQKDGLHLSENGNRIIAEKIFDGLISQELIQN